MGDRSTFTGLLLGACLGLSACAEFPELDGAISEQARAADYPVLLPMGDVLAQSTAPTRLSDTTGASLLARAEALRRRAERLRRTRIVDAAARRRMASAVTRHGS